jgi:penicillin amidase
MVTRVLLLLFLCSCVPTASNPTVSSSLSGPVEIVVDKYGWPHISATSLKDAAFGQGYAMAVDRMAQMELFRRTSQGTLAEVYGSISGDFLKSDILFRTVGLQRAAEKMWAATTDRRSRDVFEGFSAGVNQYLDELHRGEKRAPVGSEVILGQLKKPWTPVDSFSVLRLMEMFLTFNADAEITRTDLSSRVSAQLAGELMPFAPMSKAVTLPNFYAQRLDFPKSDIPRSRKKAGAPLRRLSHRSSPRESVTELATTLEFLKKIVPPQSRLGMGTNTWAVSGKLAKNGHALLANDPHLPFTSPSILWGVHFTVTASKASGLLAKRCIVTTEQCHVFPHS